MYIHHILASHFSKRPPLSRPCLRPRFSLVFLCPSCVSPVLAADICGHSGNAESLSPKDRRLNHELGNATVKQWGMCIYIYICIYT